MIRLAITLGDPAGIGPEVVDLALHNLPKNVAPPRILGRRGTPGCPTSDGAQNSWDALEEAVALAQSGEVDAVVTGPVSKNQLHQVGFPFPGQTEFFAARSFTSNFAMCLTGGGLTVALVTAHVPLREVRISTSEIVRVALLIRDHLRQRGVVHPRIAVAGLNPHAGENGDLGREEIEHIFPALTLLQGEADATFAGPFPPDTIFYQAAIQKKWDGVVCMYHDQGLIPLKLHAFDEGVNVTLGLPFVRTSPDHGTAFDIAGKGQASPRSMEAAIFLAAALAAQGG